MRVRPSLVALNGVLLVLLAIATLAPRDVDGAQPARPRGRYTMVAGEVTGPTPKVVYVVDAVNGEIIALRWDSSRSVLGGIGYRNIAADANVAVQGGPR